MSKILGIIGEYNPFHNGHLYHIEESKKIIDPTYTVVVITGNFAQRGAPSIINKWEKTKILLEAGVDLVLEMPTIYSISSAENFAQGAIKIFESFKSTTILSFGSECGDVSILKDIATILNNEPQEYKSILAHELSAGNSYPKAREKALLMYLNDVRRYSNILSGPNNTLGIEYIRAIQQLKSSVIPYTIKRNGPDYDSLEVVGNIASATAIREKLKKERSVVKLMPSYSSEILNEQYKYGKTILDLKSFEKEILYKFRTMSLDEIKNLPDVSEGLENKIKSSAYACNELEELLNLIKSKRYTRTRLQRICLYSILNITKKDMLDSYKVYPYIRVLGFNKSGKMLLSRTLSKNKKLPIITSVKKFQDSNSNRIYKNMLGTDILATNVYTLGYECNSKANLDYTEKIIIK